MKISDMIKDYEDRNFKLVRLNPKLIDVNKIYEWLVKNNKNLEEVIVVAR